MLKTMLTETREKRVLTEAFRRAIRKRFDGDSGAIRINLGRFGFLPHVIVCVLVTLMAIRTRQLTPFIILRSGNKVFLGFWGLRLWG